MGNGIDGRKTGADDVTFRDKGWLVTQLSSCTVVFYPRPWGLLGKKDSFSGWLVIFPPPILFPPKEAPGKKGGGVERKYIYPVAPLFMIIFNPAAFFPLRSRCTTQWLHLQ